MEQLHGTCSQFESLPSLGIFLNPYKKRIFVWFVILLLENSVVPVILYYGLRYGSNTKPWLVCTLVTSLWGFILYLECAIAVWKLIYRWSAHRPLTSSHFTMPTTRRFDRNSSDSFMETNLNFIRLPPFTTTAPSRWSLDTSHWIFMAILTITLAELIIATIPSNPYIKLLAMVNPSMLCAISLALFLLDGASFFHIRAPFRISSIAKGEFVRPGIYTLLEDVVSVDLHGGYAFRARFNERWEASPRFRQLLYRLSILWSLPGLLISAVCTIVILMADDDIGFAVGWTLPYVWAILWTPITLVIVGRGLSKEKQEWETIN